MPDLEDDGFTEEAFKSLEGAPAVVADPPADDPATPPAPAAEPPKDDPKPPEEPKKDEEPAKAPEEPATPAGNEKKPEEGAKPPETPAAPKEPETPPAAQPLTKDDVTSVVSNLLSNERSSSKELETTTKEVLDAYYPEGLSNTITQEGTGKELKTPADVVEASGGKMTTEEAAQWLMNEQFAVDREVNKIRDDARKIAETTVNFKRDAVSAVQKYAPLFEKYPVLQKKVYDKLMKQVKVDEQKNVILSAPDVMEHYDDYLEPYQMAFEHSTKTPATAPVPAAPAPKPGQMDRLDEGGDGAPTPPNDPNDFAQQVTKELGKD